MGNFEKAWKRSWKVMEFQKLKRVRTLEACVVCVVLPGNTLDQRMKFEDIRDEEEKLSKEEERIDR